MIGLALRHQRLIRGLTQDQLGEFWGITFQQVQKYEQEQNRLSAESLYKLLIHWNITFEEFLTLKLEPTTPAMPTRVCERLRRFLSIPVKHQMLLLKLYTNLKEEIRDEDIQQDTTTYAA